VLELQGVGAHLDGPLEKCDRRRPRAAPTMSEERYTLLATTLIEERGHCACAGVVHLHNQPKVVDQQQPAPCIPAAGVVPGDSTP
jgi:hypothetical protein